METLRELKESLIKMERDLNTAERYSKQPYHNLYEEGFVDGNIVILKSVIGFTKKIINDLENKN